MAEKKLDGKFAVKYRGKFAGIDPKKQAAFEQGEQEGYPIYVDRAAGGSWEAAEVIDLGVAPGKDPDKDREFAVEFPELTWDGTVRPLRVVAMADDGTLQSRKAGTRGVWERLRATEQPDGVLLLYRVKEGRLVGACELVRL